MNKIFINIILLYVYRNGIMFEDIAIVKIVFKAIHEDDCDIEINLIIIVLNL